MEIIPAIDLKGGKCVRLYQGDFSQETVFSHKPAKVALRWQELGAPRLHIVDLDGAARGEPVNIPVIREIIRRVSLPTQLGGGIRRLETIEQLLNLGINRIILGTAAIEDTRLVETACQRFAEAIALSLDAREGKVATWGWQRSSSTTALELADKMAALGARRFIYTDISRDGTLTQPNFEAIAELVSKTRLPVIASGGISTVEHLKSLKGLGVEGAIVGKALYTGDLSLTDALEAVREKPAHKFDPSWKDDLDSPERRKALDPEALLNFLPIKEDSAIADIGAGTGFFTLPLAERLPKGRVYALDISEEMLAVLRGKLAGMKKSDVEAKLCGEQDFPLPEGSLDGVLLFFVLHETEDRSAFLGEVKSLLKPGGWIALLEWLKKPTPKGPPLEVRIDPAQARKLAEEAGLKVLWEKPVGENYYLQLWESLPPARAQGGIL